MVNLLHLNDGELNMNLETRMGLDLGYCYCGNTCVTINLFYDQKGFPKHLKKVSHTRSSHVEPHMGTPVTAVHPFTPLSWQALQRSKTEYLELLAKETSPPDHSHCLHEGGYINGDQGPEKVFDPFAEDVKALYVGAKREANPPHVYSIVSECYNGLFNATIDGPPKEQAIIITGESGAGKTFTTGKVLDYLDTINRFRLQELKKESTGGGLSLTNRIMMTMPIMDAFGNACMPRNDDSSRFGKLYKIYFDKRNHTVTGAEVTPYLLEKARVCSQSSWERNFHIFYQLTMAAQEDAGMKAKYKLLEPGEYLFLNRFLDDPEVPNPQPGEPAIGSDDTGVCQFEICDKAVHDNTGSFEPKKPGMDAKNFLETREALSAVGFTDEAVDELFRIVSGVLLLGNVPFEYRDPQDTPKITDEGAKVVSQCGELLGVDPAALTQCLLHGSYKTPSGQVKLNNYQAHKALKLRDSLARTVYNDVFEEIIAQFSSRLIPKSVKSDTFMGVLDIFGFEFVEQAELKPGKLVNSFEQFCINLCNEKLQNHFVQCVFAVEISQYQSENLKVSQDDFDFVPNDKTLDMLQGPPQTPSTPCNNPNLHPDSRRAPRPERCLGPPQPDM